MAAGLAAHPAAAAARLQGGDAALEGHALPAAEAAGPHRVPAPAARPAPALPAPAHAPPAAGGRLCPRAACPAGGHAPCQPHGGRVPVQRHGRRGRGHAAALPAPPRHPRQVRAQRGCPAGAGAVQAPEPAAAVRVPEHSAGEPGAAGQGDAAGAQGGATGHPAGRLHRRHHPEPAGRGAAGPAAAAGRVPGPDGGSAVAAALADPLPAPARPRSPRGAPGAAPAAAAGHGRSRGASAGPRHREPLTPGTGNQLLPWPWETGSSPPDEGLEARGRNSHGMPQLHRAGSGDGGLALRVLRPPQVPRGVVAVPLCSLGIVPAALQPRSGVSGSSQRRRRSAGWSLQRGFGHSQPGAFGMGLCSNTAPTPGSLPCPLKSVCGDAEASWAVLGGGWVRGWGERPGLLWGSEGAELGVGEGNARVGMPRDHPVGR